MDQNQPGQKCSCPHHYMMSGLIILIGLMFLLEALGVISAYVTGIIWPILLILVGLHKMFKHKCKCCKVEPAK